jgi:hypothetical protein
VPESKPIKPQLMDVAGLLLTGTALVLEPMTGVAAFVARIAVLGSFGLADNQLKQVEQRVSDLHSRVQALEATRLPTRQLRGDPIDLLAFCLQIESQALYNWASCDDAMTALAWDPRRYRHAAEELKELGLVEIDIDQNHHSGIARTRLTPVGFLAAAPILLLTANVEADLVAVLAFIKECDDYRIPTSLILSRTALQPPVLDLILRALEDLGHINRDGPGDGSGSAMYQEITPRGRRMLRGDDPLIF